MGVAWAMMTKRLREIAWSAQGPDGGPSHLGLSHQGPVRRSSVFPNKNNSLARVAPFPEISTRLGA